MCIRDRLSTTKRTLLVQSSNFPIEVLFLRDDDIPQTVEMCIRDRDNAIPSVKEVANFVTKSNLEDGVAFAIEKYVLN